MRSVWLQTQSYSYGGNPMSPWGPSLTAASVSYNWYNGAALMAAGTIGVSESIDVVQDRLMFSSLTVLSPRHRA